MGEADGLPAAQLLRHSQPVTLAQRLGAAIVTCATAAVNKQTGPRMMIATSKVAL